MKNIASVTFIMCLAYLGHSQPLTSVSPTTGTYTANNVAPFNFLNSYIIQAESNVATPPQPDSFSDLLVLTNRNPTVGQVFRTAMIIGNEGSFNLRRSQQSSVGMNFSTTWINTGQGSNSTGGFISFSPRDAGNGNNPTERMRITIGGNVGIGTTTPATQLHSTGSVRFAGLTSTTNPPRTIVSDATGNLFFVSGAPVTSYCSTANTIPMMSGANAMGCSNITQVNNLANCTTGTHIGVGINGTPIATAISGSTCNNIMLTVNGSALANGGVWIASDRRVKKDIVSIESGLEKVLQMRGVHYSFDNREFQDMELPEGTTSGFIAQELQEIIPEAVGQTEKGLHVVNYDVIIPYLVASIQEQNKIIEEQKLSLNEYSQKLSHIENKLSKVTGLGSQFGKIESKLDFPQYFKVSPNPFNTRLSVSYNVEKVANSRDSKATFKLFNALGQEVFSFDAKEQMGEFYIETGNFSNGMYFLNLFVNNKIVETTQVVK